MKSWQFILPWHFLRPMLIKVLNGAGDVLEDVTSGGLSGDRANRVRNGGQTEASMMQGCFICVNHIFLVIKNALAFAL
jgi:hypothetical protein